MYKIIVVSDSHGRRNILDDLVVMYPEATYFLHAGDSMLLRSQIDPYLTVSGNCDFLIRNPSLCLEVGGITIYMIHGHQHRLTDEALFYEAKIHNANIIIHGHTHSRKYNVVDNVHILCPGSLAFSRKGKESYAIITFNDVNDIQVEIKDV